MGVTPDTLISPSSNPNPAASPNPSAQFNRSDTAILAELRVISYLLNEGLSLDVDIDLIRDQLTPTIGT